MSVIEDEVPVVFKEEDFWFLLLVLDTPHRAEK